jgi:hypothetical protein
LEPPSAAGGDGYAVMTFFGSLAPGSGNFIATSAEPYRWAAGTIEISRRDSDLGARFTGTIDARGVRLTSLGGASVLEPGTLLEFVAAPEEPITRDWSDTFDFGPPHVQVGGRANPDDPEAQELIRQWLATREPERRRAARLRLERAWHATPTTGPDSAT